MGLFDDVVGTAKSAAGVVSKKATEIYDSSKLKVKAANLKADINKQFEAYGKAVYNDYPDSEQEQIKDKIEDLLKELEELNDLIVESKNQVKCPTCGKLSDNGNAFCSSCGTPLPLSDDKETCESAEDVTQQKDSDE